MRCSSRTATLGSHEDDIEIKHASMSNARLAHLGRALAAWLPWATDALAAAPLPPSKVTL